MADTNEINDTLIYYAVFHNNQCFRGFWRPCFGKEEFYEPYYFQYPEILSDELVHVAGRGTGKSLGLETWLTQQAIITPLGEILITAFRQIHVRDRMESFINAMYRVKYFKQFLLDKNPVRRQPTYEVKLKSGVTVYGVSVGEDLGCVNLTGLHPRIRVVDEASFFPNFAFIQLQGASSPELGSIDRWAGVADGRVDSPFRRLDSASDSMAKHRLHISRRFNPALTTEQLNDLFSRYGGENSTDAKNQIDACWGEPMASAWDLEVIKNCMILDKKDPDYSAYVAEIKRERFEEMQESLEAFITDLPYKDGVDHYFLAIDVGGGLRPTVIMIISDSAGTHGKRKYQLLGRISAFKVTTPQSAKIIDYIYREYSQKAKTLIGIDCTSGDGRSIADTLEDPKGKFTWIDYKGVLKRIAFQSTVKTGEEKTPEGKIKEIKESIKELSYRVLKNIFMIKGTIKLPYDSEILEEFGSEMKVWEARAGRYYLKTPDTIHIPEAMRCFSYLVWLLYEAGEQMLVDTNEFVMPQVGGTPTILRTGYGK